MQGIISMLQVMANNFSYMSVYVFPFSLSLIAMVYLIVRRTERNHNYLYLVTTLFFVWLCPFFAVSMLNFFWNGEAYYRALFLVPGVSVTAYALVCARQKLDEKKKWAFWIGVFVLVQVAAGFSYTDRYWDFGLTNGKVSAEVMQIGDEIKERGIEAYVLAPPEIGSQLREYDLSAKIYYDGNFGYDESDMEKTVQCAAKNECNLLIIRKTEVDDDCKAYLEEREFQYLTETEHYMIYVYL